MAFRTDFDIEGWLVFMSSEVISVSLSVQWSVALIY